MCQSLEDRKEEGARGLRRTVKMSTENGEMWEAFGVKKEK